MYEHKCHECNKEFDNQDSLDQHKKDKHLVQEHVPKKSNTIKYASIGIVILLIIGLGVFFALSNPTKSTVNVNLPKTGIHWHPKLFIYIKDKPVTIPASIGLIGGEQPIHTHDIDNVIHYEFDHAPVFEEMRLGKFFQIWGKTFNRTCIFEYCNNENSAVKMFVNGVQSFEYDNYIPADLDKIEIRYDSAKTE